MSDACRFQRRDEWRRKEQATVSTGKSAPTQPQLELLPLVELHRNGNDMIPAEIQAVVRVRQAQDHGLPGAELSRARLQLEQTLVNDRVLAKLQFCRLPNIGPLLEFDIEFVWEFKPKAHWQVGHVGHFQQNHFVGAALRARCEREIKVLEQARKVVGTFTDTRSTIQSQLVWAQRCRQLVVQRAQRELLPQVVRRQQRGASV